MPEYMIEKLFKKLEVKRNYLAYVNKLTFKVRIGRK